jgi:hypothetical protein
MTSTVNAGVAETCVPMPVFWRRPQKTLFVTSFCSTAEGEESPDKRINGPILPV